VRFSPKQNDLYRAFVDLAVTDGVEAERRELLEYRGRKYTKITSPKRLGDIPTVWLATMEDSQIVSLNEEVLKRAIDREVDRRHAKPGDKQGKPAATAAPPWLGKNVGLQISRKGAELLAHLAAPECRRAMQQSSWGNLPILNEWKRLYPREDPVEVHRRIWHTELVCPGGGRYVWNEKWQTMESTVYGHPGQPKPGVSVPPTFLDIERANFGLTLENRSLRAAFVIERRPPGK
jgi:hypothetical protein